VAVAVMAAVVMRAAVWAALGMPAVFLPLQAVRS